MCSTWTFAIGGTHGSMISTFRKPTLQRTSLLVSIMPGKLAVDTGLSRFDEILATPWDQYYVFIYGAIRELTPGHTLIDEAFCYLHPDVLPARNRDRLLREFAARF